MAGRSILTIDTLEPDRDFIVVNKQPYYLRSDDELSLSQIAKIRRTAKIAMEHGITVDSSDEDILRVEAFVDEVLGIVLVDLPADVREKLSTLQKFQIVQAFMTVASSKRAGMAAGKASEENRSTGVGSSQGSEGTTEEASLTT